jgi:hypothetical protein
MGAIDNNITDPVIWELPNTEGFGWSADWEERWGSRSLHSDAIGQEGSSAVLVGVVPWGQRYNAVEQILGFHYVDRSVADEPILFRRPPIKHPRWSWMTATKILNVTGLKPTGTESYPQSKTLGLLAAYEKAELTVMFETLPYRTHFPADVALADRKEYHRYVSFEYEPIEEVIMGQLGQMKFAEGATPTGIAFPQTIGLIYPKLLIRMTWHMVPEDWIFNTTGNPINILDAVGKVNDDVWMGYDAGTLRMKAPRIVRKITPIGVPGEDVEFLYDVTLNLEFFQPPKGAVSAYEGHNLLPFRGDRQFYYATHDGTLGGTPIFASHDFDMIFTHAQ